MTWSVAVAGASGYAGGEVLRILSSHPAIDIGAIAAHSSAGMRVADVHPHLLPLAERTFTDTTAEALADHDVVILALPHGASAAIAAELPPTTIVLDCGADHRLASAQAWLDYYGSDHAGTWPYGMPELIVPQGRQRAVLATARRIAVPGCNVTAVTLGMQPGVAAGVVDPTDIVAVLAVGYSGAGKSPKVNLLAAEALSGAVPYAVGGSHRHIPEIEQNLAAVSSADIPVRVSFTPVLVPMARGILATTTAPLADGHDDASVREAWHAAYADEPFVHLLPEGQWPSTQAVLGANTALVQVAVDTRARRVVTVTAIDNLVKGTAGAAIQSMNLALGLPESTGLTTIGVAP